MPKPQVLPLQSPQGLIPPNEVIESLRKQHPKKPVELIVHNPTSSPEEAPFSVLPLTWEEMTPSRGKTKEILGKAAIGVVSFFIAIGAWMGGLEMVSRHASTHRSRDVSSPAMMTPTAPSAPTARKAAPRARVAIPSAPVSVRVSETTAVQEAAAPTPEKLTARFYSPAMVELSWDSVGQDYRYQLYSAQTPTMAEAKPETDGPIPNAYMAWIPRGEADAIWVAVTSIDPQGRESSFSNPMLVRLR